MHGSHNIAIFQTYLLYYSSLATGPAVISSGSSCEVCENVKLLFVPPDMT